MRYTLWFAAFSLLFSAFTQAQESIYAVSKWRIGITGGGGYLLASTKEAAKSFENSLGIDYQKAKKGLDQLKWQLQLGGDVHYFIREHWGLGVKYIYANSNSSINDVTANANGDGITYEAGNIESQYFINFIGPSFIGRSFFDRDKRLSLTSTVAIGYSHMRLEQLTINYPTIGTSNSGGVFSSIGLDYYVTKRLSLGADLGVFISSFQKIKYKNSYENSWVVNLEDNRDNVSNINMSVNVRIYL